MESKRRQMWKRRTKEVFLSSRDEPVANLQVELANSRVAKKKEKRRGLCGPPFFFFAFLPACEFAS